MAFANRLPYHKRALVYLIICMLICVDSHSRGQYVNCDNHNWISLAVDNTFKDFPHGSNNAELFSRNNVSLCLLLNEINAELWLQHLYEPTNGFTGLSVGLRLGKKKEEHWQECNDTYRSINTSLKKLCLEELLYYLSTSRSFNFLHDINNVSKFLLLDHHRKTDHQLFFVMDSSTNFVRQMKTTQTSEESSSQEDTGSDSDDTREKRHSGRKQQKGTRMGCACECRASDRAKGGRFRTRPCRMLWRIPTPFTTTAPPHAHNDRITVTYTFSGKRCRKLQCRSWGVDAAPNRKGQAKRNDLSRQDQKLDIESHKPQGPGRSGHEVDLLLMCQNQRQAADASGAGSVLLHLLVSLACAARLLGDQWQREPQELKKSSWMRLLLHGPRDRIQTLKSDTDKALSIGAGFAAADSYRIVGEIPRSEKSCCGQNHRGPGFPKQFLSAWVKELHHHQTPSLVVAPASGFLPSVTSGDGGHLDHVGYRLASLAAVPASCRLSRVRLAEAGFHYQPALQPAAVLCHQCGASYSLHPRPHLPPPLQYHRQQSPHCQFFTSFLDNFIQPPPETSSSVTPSTDHSPAEPRGMPHSTELIGSAPLTSLAAAQASTGSQLDGRQLVEDCEGTAPGSVADIPASVSYPVPQQSIGSYTLALPSASTDQRAPAPSSRCGGLRPGQPALQLSNAVYPHFSTREARLASFSNWPLAPLFPPQSLVGLGFFFAGYADCLRCFYCGVGLKNWDAGDDVLQEHIRWRPHCGFLLATNGPSFIQRTLNNLSNETNNTDSPNDTIPEPQPQNSHNASHLTPARNQATLANTDPPASSSSSSSSYIPSPVFSRVPGAQNQAASEGVESPSGNGAPGVNSNASMSLTAQRSNAETLRGQTNSRGFGGLTSASGFESTNPTSDSGFGSTNPTSDSGFGSMTSASDSGFGSGRSLFSSLGSSEARGQSGPGLHPGAGNGAGTPVGGDGGEAVILRQVLTMGFPLEDIKRAEEQLRSSGQPCDVDTLVNRLLDAM